MTHVSASSLKEFTSCSMAFYYKRILRCPERTWARTVVGSLVHSIFECLRHPRHRHHYDAIVTNSTVDYRRSRALTRLIRAWQVKHAISNELLADVNGMLYVGLLLADFFWVNADKDANTGRPLIYGPEHEFVLILEDGTQIKGYIDDMAVVGGVMVIRDWKSYRNKMTANDTLNSLQAKVYQLYVWKKFGLQARVEFIALRHAPTIRAPKKHLQLVEEVSFTQLLGFEQYVMAVAAQMRRFGLSEAYAHPHKDEGFCKNVCSHYAPHPYYVLCDSDDPEGDNPISSHLTLDLATQARETRGSGVILTKQHTGCAVRWTQRT